MERKYQPHSIEKKWQSRWPLERESYKIAPGEEDKLYYCLDMFSYPSSEGLHMGHWRPYTLADVWARYQTLRGKKVLHPVGFDAFGLPAENAAIKTQTPPDEYTRRSIENFSRQIKEMGKMYDWSTQVVTSSPEYYRWTQWLFLQLYKHGLAYRKKSLVNWCPSCQTVLANEQVINGECERCGTAVTKKELKQWFFKITDFAEDLLSFDGLHWPERVKNSQQNWIGKSEGAEIHFPLVEGNERITVFTTRPDTLFGVTYLVLAPEHPLAETLATMEQRDEVRDYIASSIVKTEIDRLAEDRQKTGIFTGSYARHPLTDQSIPIWIADYVLPGYGTGAVMAVPAHDTRDYAFAQKYHLPIVQVVAPETGEPQPNPEFRESIVALLRNPITNEILTLDWGSKGGKLFIGGGCEEGEDIVACAKREIAEETGYTNVSFVAQTGPIYHNYFAHSKNKARRILAHGLLFELMDESRSPLSHEQDEEGQFTMNWVNSSHVETQVCDALHALVYRLLVKGECYTGYGTVINSENYNGLTTEEMKRAIIADLSANDRGGAKTQYKLRDWLVSRQRYWGAPIPIIYCDDCGEQVVPEEDLPVRLPEDAAFMPTGGSPLERHSDFKHAACPSCGKDATRETDTLDTFVDSSWYFLRYTDPQNESQPFDPEQVKRWLPVDFYVGGVEHSILHLLYARFIMKALCRLGFVPYAEPFETFYGNGMIYLNGKKMSKSKGNIVNPDEMVKKYGTDPMRGYILFMGPADQDVEWQTSGINGVARFLQRSWKLFHQVDTTDTTIEPAIHDAVRSVTEFLEGHHFNRCISALMIAVRSLEGKKLSYASAEILCRLFAPFFPHFAEEIWSKLGHDASIFSASWPESHAKIIDEVTYVIQVNGRMRGTIMISQDEAEQSVVALARDLPTVRPYIEGKELLKTVFVAGRIVNFVVK